jgi:hypothetical protein
VVKNRIIRGIISGSIAVVPLTGATVLMAANPASAAPKGIKCTKISGSANVNTNTSKIKLATCTGNTGTKGTSKGAAAVGTSGTVKWANHKATSFSEAVATGTACPVTSTLIADEVLSGAVTTDNTGSTTVGAAVAGEVCVNSTATSGVFTITGAPGVPFTFAA